MAVIKCKMCGGSLDIKEGMTVATCEYCGTEQTLPRVDDEKKIKLFERANRLRSACEFDKAAGVYESIVSDFEFEAEAYWGLVLCKYGIEYVDDPATKKKVPTCHRSSFESVQDDPNYDLALENADIMASGVYRKEAFDIEELRKGIIEVSSKEEPYDIFISYKELDETGNRTVDSVIAQDIYSELTEKGYRVFFSRITLEDKLGTEYEPYIFAALNSAKLMLVVGTSFENFNAVWVKNEWSRFLSLMASGKKKTLIPCFKDINPYDMPKEFAKLSAQDMGKVGAMQDLMRGVEKILPRKKEVVPGVAPMQQASSPNVDTLLKRGMMFLEDKAFAEANEYFDKVLDIDPQNGEAYYGKLMVELKVSCINEIVSNANDAMETVASARSFRRFEQFGTAERKNELEQWIEKWDEVKENERIREAEEAEYRRKKYSEYIEKYPEMQKTEEIHRKIAASRLPPATKEALCSSDKERILYEVKKNKLSINYFSILAWIFVGLGVWFFSHIGTVPSLSFICTAFCAGCSAFLFWFAKNKLKPLQKQLMELLKLCDIPSFEEFLAMQENEELNSKDGSAEPEKEPAQ